MDPRRFDCRFNLLQQRPRFLLAQKVTITLGYFLGPSLGIDTKKLVHLRHDPNRGLIFGIEFNRVKKFPPCMCPTACMHDSGSAHSVICTVAVALEYSCKISKEPFGSFPFTPKPEIEHHRPVGSTVLPEISLAVLSSAIVHLYAHRSFIRLDVVAFQNFPSHCGYDRTQQFANSHHPTVHRRPGQLDPRFPLKDRALVASKTVGLMRISLFIPYFSEVAGRGDLLKYFSLVSWSVKRPSSES